MAAIILMDLTELSECSSCRPQLSTLFLRRCESRAKIGRVDNLAEEDEGLAQAPRVPDGLSNHKKMLGGIFGGARGPFFQIPGRHYCALATRMRRSVKALRL
jgi:hypothetical protein